VESAIALVRSRYREYLTLEDVATFLGTSPSYLSRLIRRELDTTFGELLTSLRLAHARKLLGESDVPIQSVAESVGYENGYYFSRVFKKHYGATPTEYRRVHRRP
jgi:YesN/AraC family two-component response regulator